MRRKMLVLISMTMFLLVNFTSLVPEITHSSVSNMIHNDVADGFNTFTYEDAIPANTLMEGSNVTGFLLCNLPDGTGESILAPNVTLTSLYGPESFGRIPSPNSTSRLDSKYVYTWTRSELPEVSPMQVSMMQVQLRENKSCFNTLNFASERHVIPSIVDTETAVVNLTIKVMPVETVERLCIAVYLENTTDFEVTVIQNQVVPQQNPVYSGNFTSTDEVQWEILNAVAYKEYTFTVPMNILNKLYPESVSYKPKVVVFTHYNFEYWQEVQGSQVSFTHPRWGNLTFSAEGTYTWLAVWKLGKVSLLGYQSNIESPVSVASQWLRNRVILDGGITYPSEWAETNYHDIVLARSWRGQRNFSETITARYWFKNDATFLYFLARVAWSAGDVDVSDLAFIELFWGQYVPPWEHADGGLVTFGNLTWDGYGLTDGTWYGDMGWAYNDTSDEWIPHNAGGQNNVAGRASHDGTFYWFELRKALDSGDGYDWSLAPGQIVGSEYAPAETPNLLVGVRDRNDTNRGGVRSIYQQYISLYLSPQFPPVSPLSGTWVSQGVAQGTFNLTWIGPPIPRYKMTILSGSGSTNGTILGNLTGTYNGTVTYIAGISTGHTETHSWDLNITGHLYVNTTERPFFSTGEAFNLHSTISREIVPGVYNSTWTAEIIAYGKSWANNEYIEIVSRGISKGYTIWNTTDLTWNSFSSDFGTWEGKRALTYVFSRTATYTWSQYDLNPLGPNTVPFSDRFGILFSQHDANGVIDLAVPKESYSCTPAYDPVGGATGPFTWQLNMTSDGYGKLYTLDDVGDVDIISMTNDTGTYFWKDEAWHPAGEEWVGNGILDSAGSSWLYLPVNASVYQGNGTDPAKLYGTFRLDFWLTTGFSENTVVEPASRLNGFYMNETGIPFNATSDIVTYVQTQARLDIPYMDGLMDLQYKAERSGVPPPAFIATLFSPANLYVTDPENRHIGTNPKTGKAVNEIPGAFYTGPGSEPQRIIIPNPLDGVYDVEIVGTGTGSYTLVVELATPEKTTTHTYTSNVSVGQVLESQATVSGGEMTATSPNPGPGDANSDGHVNLLDLSMLADHWFNTPTYDSRVDFDRNGFIDLSDLSMLADHWFKGPKD